MDPSGSRAPGGAAEVWPALPLAVTCSVMFQYWFWYGVSSNLILPMICSHMCSVSSVSCHSASGLTTGLIPDGDRAFQIDLDFIDHTLQITTSDGVRRQMPLFACTVATFYADLMASLAALGIAVTINPIPVEVPHAIPCDTNEVHKDYDPEYVTRWWRIMLGTTRVMQRFSSRFAGKTSPPHFYWGSFDLSQTRHSGHPATPPEGAPLFVRLSENEENAACGFWPGNTAMSGLTYGEPAFYAYCYPAPDRYATGAIRPSAAYFDEQFGEFILRYEDVRRAADPEQAILDFFESAYEIAADKAGWDRERLEFDPPARG